ncbi:IS200/IS605 family transposase [Candidatus Woesearchaeota archaeon]|nr:IS200/IS605 family transposase [Candidatus Woesearchaeota archaeon]
MSSSKFFGCEKLNEVSRMNRENSDIKRFSHNIGQNWYHIVLVTKKRGKIFQWKETKNLAYKAFEWVCSRHNIDLFAKEIMEDHVHLFVSCPPDYSVRKFFQILKGGSSFYIRKHYPSLKKYKHLWNRGTMYRSIGSVSSETVKHYIEKSNGWKRTKK